jgi:hypothetical protein
MRSLFGTLGMWGINSYHWLTTYLTACAENGGKPPVDIAPFIPWLMSDEQRQELARPPPFKQEGPSTQTHLDTTLL